MRTSHLNFKINWLFIKYFKVKNMSVSLFPTCRREMIETKEKQDCTRNVSYFFPKVISFSLVRVSPKIHADFFEENKSDIWIRQYFEITIGDTSGEYRGCGNTFHSQLLNFHLHVSWCIWSHVFVR